MSQLQDRIAQFRKMANDDPDNELGHYRLGQLLMEARQFPEAIQSFRRTLELSPRFSKVYQLLAQCLVDDNRREEAVAVLKQGFDVADEQGDNMPRESMARMLTELGEPEPVSKKKTPSGPEGVGGFRCQRPGCWAGSGAFMNRSAPIVGWIGCAITALKSLTSCISISARNADKRNTTATCASSSDWNEAVSDAVAGIPGELRPNW